MLDVPTRPAERKLKDVPVLVLAALAFFGLIGLAVLMIYSLDRTSWIFQLMESGRPGAEQKGWWAALVVEVAVVSLIISEGSGELMPEHYRKTVIWWSTTSLIAILVVQASSNLLGGFVRGMPALHNEIYSVFGKDITPDSWLPWIAGAVMGLIWFFSNALIPFLIFGLSKIEGIICRVLFEKIVLVFRADSKVTLDTTQPAMPPATEPELLPVPVSPTRTWTLPSLLSHFGVSQITMLQIIAKRELDTAEKAWALLQERESIPVDMTFDAFSALYDELIASAPAQKPTERPKRKVLIRMSSNAAT